MNFDNLITRAQIGFALMVIAFALIVIAFGKISPKSRKH